MQTIGERLEEARKKKGISIREAAEATKIRGEYLQKFEGNQFEIGLTDIYTRGFLRGYANYLRIPSDRLLNDYTALSGGEPRLRQPSREVYGRMDLAISSADERGEAQGEAQAAEPVQRHPPRAVPAPGRKPPQGPADRPQPGLQGRHRARGDRPGPRGGLDHQVDRGLGARRQGDARRPVGGRRAGRDAGPRRPPRSRSSRSEAVRIKVVRKSDGVELFQGPLQAGERKEFPNVPLFLTASDQAAVEIEYKGRRYPTGYTGHERIQFDFSNR